MKKAAAQKLYEGRKLAEGYPNLENQGVASFAEHQSNASTAILTVLEIQREIGVPDGNASVAIVGCGPKPASVKALHERGFQVTGVEPVAGHVESAQKWLGMPEKIRQGSAEVLPFNDESVGVVLIESVLEHVDSPIRSLQEAYRVLAPGGVAYVQTTNRHRISLKGDNGEFTIPFLNWMPNVVKEAAVHHHLHFNPKLAAFSPRPAVHWFSYGDLCKLGRDVGFHQFYSKFDLIAKDDPRLQSNWLRAKLIDSFRYNMWLRSIALTQYGDAVYMLKRKD